MRVRLSVMVFNVTFNNISVISWRSVLLVEETRVFLENYRPIASNCKNLNIYGCIEYTSPRDSKSKSSTNNKIKNKILNNDWCYMWSRNCLPFWSAWVHARFLVGFVSLNLCFSVKCSVNHCWSFCLFLLIFIVLFVHFRIMPSDYLLDIIS